MIQLTCLYRSPQARYWFLLGALMSSALALIARHASAEERAGSEVRLKNVVNAWSARQERVGTARFKWKVVRTNTQLSLSKGVPGQGSFPAQDTSYTREITMAFDPQRYRQELNGPIWNADTQALAPNRITRVFDGESIKRASGPIRPGGAPSGSVVDKGRSFAGTEHAPILLCFRPFDRRVGGVVPESLSVSGTENVAGHECLLVTAALGTNRLQFAVDPLREFVILRQTLHKPTGELRYQFDIDYQQDAAHGWLPKGWRFVSLGSDQKARTTDSATVLSYAIGVPLDDRDFSVEFPPGSEVVDDVEGVSYVVRPDGGRRVVGASTRNQAEPVADHKTQFVIAALLAVAAMTVWLAIQYFRR